MGQLAAELPSLVCSEVLKFKYVAEQFSRVLGNDDRVRHGHRLQARCQIRCLSHDPCQNLRRPRLSTRGQSAGPTNKSESITVTWRRSAAVSLEDEVTVEVTLSGIKVRQ